jgi:hypothetical protein
VAPLWSVEPQTNRLKMKRRNYNDKWFLDEISKQPTLSAKIRKWLQLEYKIFFEPTTSRPKIPTPLWVTVCHLKRTVPSVIKGTAINFARSFAWHLNCYKQFWRLPNIIEGFQYKLSAEKEWHKHYKEIAEDKTKQVEFIMKEEVATIAYHKEPNEVIKGVYEKWDLYVPDEYMTEEQYWDRAIDEHESYMNQGGIGDFDHIYCNEEKGNKLLGGFDDKI